MLQPKRRKHTKAFRPQMGGIATRGNKITVGEFALQSLQRKWLTGNQIEAARKVIVREMKRKGKLWIRIFPDQPYTKKPAEVTMGTGKGDVEKYIAVVKPGRVLFEISGVPEVVAHESLRKAAQKLPVLTKIITKEGHQG